MDHPEVTKLPHFELPLKVIVDPEDVTKVGVVEPEAGNSIFTMDDDNTDEGSLTKLHEATFIVTAVNNHESLVANLQRLLNCPDLNLDSLEPETLAAIAAANSALNKLKRDYSNE